MYSVGLGFFAICATAGRTSETSFCQTQLGQEQETRSRLVQMRSSTGQRISQCGFSFWKTSNFTQVCDGIQLGRQEPPEKFGGPDALLRNKLGRRSYPTFQKHALDLELETELPSFGRFDTLIACIIDSMIDASDTNVPYTWTNCDTVNHDAVSMPDTMTADNSVGQYGILPDPITSDIVGKNQLRGGRRPMGSVRKFKTYLPSEILN